MKFLCVPCDEQMKIHETIRHQDLGSLSVVFSCPSCGRSTAMLTNPGETQLVSSLGIKVGNESTEKASQCPFANMLGGGEPVVQSQSEQTTLSQSQPAPQTGDGVRWSLEAEQRLERVPEFVRPMAKMGIEKYAIERGHQTVTVEILDRAKDMFGM